MRAVQLGGDEQVALRYLAQVTPLTPTTCRHMLGASFADLLATRRDALYVERARLRTAPQGS